jgi:hypothetical protein
MCPPSRKTAASARTNTLGIANHHARRAVPLLGRGGAKTNSSAAQAL